MSNKKMKRNLSARHISMMAIGGCIGTGIFMASGSVVSQTGSYGAMLSYIIVGIVMYFLMASLGELASFYPVSGSFISYSTRFIDPSLGFTLGWLYSILWIMIIGVDILTLTKVLKFWELFRSIPTFALCIVFLIIMYIINLVSTKLFGEIEYWLTIIKVAAVIAFLVVGALIILGVTGSTSGFSQFTENKTGTATGLLGFFGILSTVAFSFGGTESVAVTSGESQEPSKTMPKAVNQVFWRILIFYIATMFVISSTLSVKDERLLDSSNINASPFTIVFQNAGLNYAATIMNAVIVTSVFSAANVGLYMASRQLFSLSTSKYAPKALSKLNGKSIPVVSLTIAAIFVVFSFVFERFNANGYYQLLGMVGMIVLLIWFVSIVAQIRLRAGIKKQGKDLNDLLPYKSKFGLVGSFIALIVFVVIFVLQIYADYSEGGFEKTISTIAAPLVALVLYITFKTVNKTKIVKLEEMDLTKYKH